MEPGNPTHVNDGLGSRPVPSLGLYVHVPFCRVRCPFCPFYVQIHRQRSVGPFLDALQKELCLYANMPVFAGVPVSTVYVGGGTPTTLTTAELGRLLKGIRDWFCVTSDAEISIEVHPGTVSGRELENLSGAGFNRVSLGIQSFDDGDLKSLGGRVLSDTPYTTVSEARSAGFGNINLDLMFGFPGHTVYAWEHTLDRTIGFSPDHISCYGFTVEEGTVTHDEVSCGRVPGPDDDFQIGLETTCHTRLSACGYERYEISNFSRPGMACRHNMRYWQGDAVLGLGPSAHSYIGGIRFGNVADLPTYLQTIQNSRLSIDEWDPVPTNRLEREEVVFGLRLLKGVSLNTLPRILQTDQEWKHNIQGLKEKGLLTIDGGFLRLTSLGVQHADTIAVALL